MVISLGSSIFAASGAPRSQVEALVQQRLRQPSQHLRGPCGPKEALLESVRWIPSAGQAIGK